MLLLAFSEVVLRVDQRRRNNWRQRRRIGGDDAASPLWAHLPLRKRSPRLWYLIFSGIAALAVQRSGDFQGLFNMGLSSRL